MAIAKYSCSQTTFYAASREGAERVIENLADFSNLFPDYTLEKMQGIKDRIDAADALPDYDTRKLIAEALWAEVDNQRKADTYQFGLFLSKIDLIYDAPLRQSAYVAAGKKHYMDAKNGDETKVMPMYSSLMSFFADNWVALSTVAKMTTEQREEFVARQTAYKARYDAATAADRLAKDKKDEKINANNACFDEMSAYITIAQRIYADDPEMQKYFKFGSFRSEVEGVKNAGLSGKITNILNKDALKGATITILNYNKSFVTEKNGKFDISPLSAGKYTVIVECPSFETQTFKDVKIKTGATTRLNVQMVAAMRAGSTG